MLPDDESQPVVADPLDRESLLAGAPDEAASRVMSRSASLVSTSASGRGVRQCGQTSPASLGTTIAAQLGQEMTLDTELGGNYMTSGLLYFPWTVRSRSSAGRSAVAARFV